MDLQTKSTTRLQRQMKFLVEIGRLVSVVRRTLIIGGSRYENDAEHSWHMATACILLQEYACFPRVDLCRAIQMCLIHDLVEIEAGDTYAYDPAANVGREEREKQAADKIFGILPPDQNEVFRGMWDEFEARQTPEARFAAALDRVQSVILNFSASGRSWKEHGVTAAQVLNRIEPVRDATPELWAYLHGLVAAAAKNGWLRS